jgi:large subunit ribosomal protein L10
MSTRAERSKTIEGLEELLKDASGIYLTDFSGIDVERITKFRSDLRGTGAKYLVVKNKLARIALERCGKAELGEYLTGPIGIAYSDEDPVGPAKVIRDFKKDNKDLLGLKVAYVEGSLFSAEQASRLADLPSREVLLSQLLSVLKAPMTNLAGSLNGIMTKFVGVLQALKDKQEQAGE